MDEDHRRPFSTPGAHNGVKNVYTSKQREGNRRFPNGTVIVKSIADQGAKGLARHVAVMRKVRGRWQWVEYELEGTRYDVLASGALKRNRFCSSCHMQVKANNWVFTKR
ncbi:MAG: cytochrome P460 family protein [Actinobacteria bacterium]|nr:cytochrome P460 family protein [Actinomycetota bacterium]